MFDAFAGPAAQILQQLWKSSVRRQRASLRSGRDAASHVGPSWRVGLPSRNQAAVAHTPRTYESSCNLPSHLDCQTRPTPRRRTALLAIKMQGLARPCATEARPHLRQPLQSRTLVVPHAAPRQDVEATSTSSSSAAPDVHDSGIGWLESLQQFSSPREYARKVLAGHKYARGLTGVPPQPAVFLADPAAVRALMSSEMQLGVRTLWPDTFRQLLGDASIAMVQEPEVHARMRAIISPFFSPEAISRLTPHIHATVAKHMRRWADGGSRVGGYAAAKTLTFDVMVNNALQLSMDDTEVATYADVFQVWIDGFLPPAINLPIFPFGRGMKARQQLKERSQAALNDPQLPPGSLLAQFAAEWGADSETAHANVINLLFAGHDTTSSAITYMLWQLARNPAVLQQLRAEHAAALAAHGPDLTPAAIAALPYTAATIKEVLRTSQIIGYVPRTTTSPLQLPAGGPALPSRCPFVIALAEMSDADPAVSGDAAAFRPERWLDPANARSLGMHQMPFGVGQHYCLGSNLANAEMTAVLAELARHYELQVDGETGWDDFPIKRPRNGLPLRLTRIGGIA